jgi:hypothetical protein
MEAQLATNVTPEIHQTSRDTIQRKKADGSWRFVGKTVTSVPFSLVSVLWLKAVDYNRGSQLATNVAQVQIIKPASTIQKKFDPDFVGRKPVTTSITVRDTADSWLKGG